MTTASPVLETMSLKTMVGTLEIVVDPTHLRAIRFAEARPSSSEHERVITSCWKILEITRNQLNEYFAGDRFVFDLPLYMTGTPFQKSVWACIAAIPYGDVITYGEIARQLGNVYYARAVGQAANRNPVPIVVPCHRVVGGGGQLGGFAPGVHLKEILLSHEQCLKKKYF